MTPGPRPGRRIGLLGGSFNPAHDGHRHISVMALQQLDLDEVWWLVSPQNPLKPVKGMAPFADRLSYARQVARHPRIRVSDIEQRLNTQYSLDTVRALKRRFPGHIFVWLMGADILTEMPAWRRWSEFFNTVAIAVFARPSYSLRALASQAAIRYARYRLPEDQARCITRQAPPAWVFLRIRLHKASGTDMRESGRTVRAIMNADTRSGD
ncbi:MAG: nicotinate-nucleotide adenylyltransferase [Pseudomonadota bacterium]